MRSQDTSWLTVASAVFLSGLPAKSASMIGYCCSPILKHGWSGSFRCGFSKAGVFGKSCVGKVCSAGGTFYGLAMSGVACSAYTFYGLSISGLMFSYGVIRDNGSELIDCDCFELIEDSLSCAWEAYGLCEREGIWIFTFGSWKL